MNGPGNGQGRQRLRDLAFLLPCVGIFLFSPLILDVVRDFADPAGGAGLAVFIFLVWLLLIVASFLISVRIRKSAEGTKK